MATDGQADGHRDRLKPYPLRWGQGVLYRY